MKNPSLGSLLRRVHENEEGTVSLETVLVVCAIALPVLIFLYKLVWPKLIEWFWTQAADIDFHP
jgi:hypothetical protein